MGWLLAVAVLLGTLELFLLVRSGGARRDSGLPAGRIAYVDTAAWRCCERPLLSVQHGLAGRPDYLVETSQGLIPVEVKLGPAPSQPHKGHAR